MIVIVNVIAAHDNDQLSADVLLFSRLLSFTCNACDYGISGLLGNGRKDEPYECI